MIFADTTYHHHNDTIIENPTSAVHWMLPCTWKCSCDWSKVHTGWTAIIDGKIWHIEGERKNYTPPEWMINLPDKNK